MPKTKNKMTELDIAAATRAYKIWKKKKGDLKITQAQLAEMLDVTQGAISSWFHGYTPIGTNALLKLSKVFGVHPTEIRPEFQYTTAPGELPPDIARIAQKLETLPEGVRQDIERTIDSLINSNYALFLSNAGRHRKPITNK